MNQTPQVTNKDYQSKWPILPKLFVVILLIITYPLGIILMWLFTRWSIKIKLFITFGPALIIMLMMSYVLFSLNSQHKSLEKQSSIVKESAQTTTETTGRKNNTEKIWKIYKNNYFGYTLSYPESWNYQEGRLNKEKGYQIVFISPIIKSGVKITVDINKNHDNLNLEEYINNSVYSIPIISKAKLNINGNSAEQLIFRPEDGIATYIIDSKNKGNIAEMSFDVDDESQINNTVKYIDTYQKIIRTFQFDNR